MSKINQTASSLMEYLLEHPVDNMVEEIPDLSPRLRGWVFKVKAMTGPEFSKYRNDAMALGKAKKMDMDMEAFSEAVVLGQVIEPNFKDADVLAKLGFTKPNQLLYKTLLSGEIQELQRRISAISGFDKSANEEVEEVKNA